MTNKKPQAAKECLIVFTRYPEPGKTKTRMIPLLGSEGAATLQRQMTEHTLAQVKQLQNQYPISIEVYFAGGNPQLMEDWLGSNIVYQRQGEGDLGFRMVSALQSAFNNGSSGVVIIGTDCPGLNSQIMEQAFAVLANHDIVLGPAQDGGYYLIGLRRLIDELFSGISWGTSEVLQQTVEIAKQIDLAIAYLPTLADVDRPEDLPVWKQANVNLS
jgi:rSAM/selenodomain-associated transferase 1